MIIVMVLLFIDAILLVTWDVIDRPIGSNISLPQEVSSANQKAGRRSPMLKESNVFVF